MSYTDDHLDPERDPMPMIVIVVFFAVSLGWILFCGYWAARFAWWLLMKLLINS